MMIYTEATPNPDALKFIPDIPVTTGGTLDVRSADLAQGISLIESLFDIPIVVGVYIGPNFVTVTKDSGDWSDITSLILGVISDNIRQPIDLTTTLHQDRSDNSDVVNQILELLDDRIRPAVANDGGDIIFRDYQDGIVYLELQGSCSGCPSSTATLRYGVENLIKHYIPEVIEVRSI
jgi:Fe-S cluster biogenesis protein NfuA